MPCFFGGGNSLRVFWRRKDGRVFFDCGKLDGRVFRWRDLGERVFHAFELFDTMHAINIQSGNGKDVRKIWATCSLVSSMAQDCYISLDHIKTLLKQVPPRVTLQPAFSSRGESSSATLVSGRRSTRSTKVTKWMSV